jgi:hypothetical protein
MLLRGALCTRLADTRRRVHDPAPRPAGRRVAMTRRHARHGPKDGAEADLDLERSRQDRRAGLGPSVERLRHRLDGHVGLHGAIIGVEDQLGLRVREPQSSRNVRSPQQFVSEFARGEGQGGVEIRHGQTQAIDVPTQCAHRSIERAIGRRGNRAAPLTTRGTVPGAPVPPPTRSRRQRRSGLARSRDPAAPATDRRARRRWPSR